MINNKKRMYSAVLMTMFLASSTTVPFAGYSKVAVGAGAVTAAGVVATLGAVAYKKSAKVRRFCKSHYGKVAIGLFVAVVAVGAAVYNREALSQLCLKPVDPADSAAGSNVDSTGSGNANATLEQLEAEPDATTPDATTPDATLNKQEGPEVPFKQIAKGGLVAGVGFAVFARLCGQSTPEAAVLGLMAAEASAIATMVALMRMSA